jgi:hypothetical protein
MKKKEVPTFDELMDPTVQALKPTSGRPYAIENAGRVRGLIMASTLGGVDCSSIRHAAVPQAPSWRQESLQKEEALTKQGIHPGAGPRMVVTGV